MKISLVSYLLAGIADLINRLVGKPIVSNELSIGFIEELFLLFFLLFASMITFYMLRLFLEAFDHEQIMNNRTVSLGGFLLFVSTGYILTTILGATSVLDAINNRIQEDEFFLSVATIWLTWFVFFVLTVMLILGLIIGIYRNISAKKSRIDNKAIVQVLSYLQIAVILIFLGAFLPIITSFSDSELLNEVPPTISTLGLCLFIAIYLKNGVYILSNQSLRRLIIVNDGGTALYGYIFQSFENSELNKSQSQADQDILFSGALQAISSLIQEFTGIEEQLQELNMAQTTILIEPINDVLSVLLLTVNPTISIRQKLVGFVKQIKQNFEHLSPNQIYDYQQKELDRIIETLFGSGKGLNSDSPVNQS